MLENLSKGGEKRKQLLEHKNKQHVLQNFTKNQILKKKNNFIKWNKRKFEFKKSKKTLKYTY